MKEGHALCINCGREPEKKEVPVIETSNSTSTIKKTIEKKMKTLSTELEKETDHEKQQEILKTINLLLETMGKIKEDK